MINIASAKEWRTLARDWIYRYCYKARSLDYKTGSLDGIRSREARRAELERQPHQPHSGTRITSYRCFLPDLAGFTSYRCGGTDEATIETLPCSLVTGRDYAVFTPRVQYVSRINLPSLQNSLTLVTELTCLYFNDVTRFATSRDPLFFLL
ncbi:Hypothetical protein HDN1F_33550 [gamma proteobacterium HdN1]|nr:Hypothetical protein HDN1F_33550 [gamma proteobacterium HdN1]